jgi:hypothetical protein
MGKNERWSKLLASWNKGNNEGEVLPHTLLSDTTRTVTEYEELRQQLDWQDKLSGLNRGEFDSHVPAIIGYVPPNERKFLKKFMRDRIGYSTTSYPTDATTRELMEKMPETYRLIAEDAAAIDPTLEFKSWLLNRRKIAAGNSHIPIADVWHVDSGVTYLISDTFPTEFYKGKARYGEYMQLTVDSEELLTSPTFAIVRQGPKTVHRSPIIPKDLWHLFLDVLQNLLFLKVFIKKNKKLTP